MMRVLLLLWTVVFAGVSRDVSAQELQLALQISTERNEVRAGDEILITFVVTNIGAASYTYTDRTYDRSGRLGEYRLRAFGADGTPVPDPRTRSRVPRGYLGGGLSTVAELPPGDSDTKTIALNAWAFVVQPGTYTVRGTYAAETGALLESAPLVLRVLPRSDAEIADHIEALAAQLQEAVDPRLRVHLVRQLMYTADRRAVAPLLKIAAQENNTAFWIGEAFAYYLPGDSEVLDVAVGVIRQTGLAPSSIPVLEQLGAPPEVIKHLIGEALIHWEVKRRSEAALAAQRYPDDRFMPPLIALATGGPTDARVPAIFALAYHRTDRGVDALRRLRGDPAVEIRRVTEQAIEAAYRMADTARGRPLRPDDFPDIAKRQRR